MCDNTAEGRKYKRYDVDSVEGELIYASEVNIVNISMDGVCISTTQRLTINREYSIKLKFENRIHAMRGRVMWSVLSHSKTMPGGESAPVYKAGIKFSNVFTEEATHLIAYIEKNRAGAPERRTIGVRFGVKSPESSCASMASDYEVKRISMAGMLIGTDTELVVDQWHDMEINLDGACMSVTGRVANQTVINCGDIVKYDVGIEFVELSEGNGKILASYLESLGRSI
jgi:hypothetical protein